MRTKYTAKEYQKDYWAHTTNARTYSHPVVRCFAKQRIDHIKSVIPLDEVSSIFDVGCGDGFATYYLTEEVPLVEGGDISELMLANNPLGRDKLKIIDAERLDLPDNSYDMTIMWEVLHHLDDPLQAVRELARVATRYVVVFEPNRANVLQVGFGLSSKEERGTLRSSKKYLEGLFNQAGLTILDSQFCGRIPPNKTPQPLFQVLKRMPHKGGRLTSISVAIIGAKTQHR
jgi:SAM-dependent methyltransferase